MARALQYAATIFEVMIMDATQVLPGVSLSDWLSQHPCDDKVAHRVGLIRQVNFVADRLGSLLFPNRDVSGGMVRVVGKHRLLDAVAPVYAFVVDGVEVRLSCDNTFGNRMPGWMVSVRADGPILDMFFDLFDRSAAVEVEDHWGLMDWAFGSFAEDRSQFTLHFDDDHKLYTLLFLLAKALETERNSAQIGHSE